MRGQSVLPAKVSTPLPALTRKAVLGLDHGRVDGVFSHASL
jgi:hypothetical protein